MHCQKLGQDIVTSAKTQYQHWFGAGLILKDFSINLIIIFLFIISTGRTFFKTPTFGNAKRWLLAKKTMNLVITFLIYMLLPICINGQDSVQTDYSQIDRSFNDLVIQSQNIKKTLFDFKYKDGEEPNVNVVDSNYQLLLTKLEKRHILHFVNYFSYFYERSEPAKSGKYLFQEIKSFLKPGTYAVEFNYKSVNQTTTNIICLIYGQGKYILFSIGYE